jgi:NIMA (never in mitosis gene a)-related kinase 8
MGLTLSCGDNTKGCLGHADFVSLLVPKEIVKLAQTKIVQVKCGSQHVVALSTDEQIFTWGACKFGSLSLGGQKLYANQPVRIQQDLIGVREVFCGVDATAVLLKTGELYCCGRNNHDRLGLGKKVAKTYDLKRVVKIDQKVVSVSISEGHSTVLLEGGYVVTLGDNSYGQRGVGDCEPLAEPSLVTAVNNRFIKSVHSHSTYTICCSENHVITFFGTRYGIPESNDSTSVRNASNGSSSSTNPLLSSFTAGNSTAAFTNFLASIYKSELILDPIDILALFSSKEQISEGNHLKLVNVYPLHHSVLVLVDTTAPLTTSSGSSQF